MRYSENIPAEQLTVNASNDMLLFTAALSILIGIILTYLGHKGRQLWMVSWSVGLIIMSLFTASAIIFEYDGLH